MRRELLVFLLFSLILTGCSCGKTSFTPSKEIQNNAEQAISDYLDALDEQETQQDIHNEIHASTFKLFGMQEVPCSETDIKVWEAYIWQFESGFTEESLNASSCENDLKQVAADTGFSIPAKITLEEDKNGVFKAVQLDRPSDLNYASDLEELFPKPVLKEMESFPASEDLDNLQLQTTQKACEIIAEKAE
ncbi:MULTISPECIES: hypothetical protein [Bacteria]|uniref:hypothetical protein n=1 Tax=Bacteria TaxID=2 RepID=UPI0023F2D0E7|nr:MULTISPECIES: hypothetical protein [Bacteria]